MTNESKIWSFLKSKGLNDFGVAGLMGNLYAESGLNPKNLQNTHEKKLSYGDFDKWLEATIETLVREDKKTAPASVEEKQTQIATTAATAAASVAATVAQTAVAQAQAEAMTAKPSETATE